VGTRSSWKRGRVGGGGLNRSTRLHGYLQAGNSPSARSCQRRSQARLSPTTARIPQPHHRLGGMFRLEPQPKFRFTTGSGHPALQADRELGPWPAQDGVGQKGLFPRPSKLMHLRKRARNDAVWWSMSFATESRACPNRAIRGPEGRRRANAGGELGRESWWENGSGQLMAGLRATKLLRESGWLRLAGSGVAAPACSSAKSVDRDHEPVRAATIAGPHQQGAATGRAPGDP